MNSHPTIKRHTLVVERVASCDGSETPYLGLSDGRAMISIGCLGEGYPSVGLDAA